MGAWDFFFFFLRCKLPTFYPFCSIKTSMQRMKWELPAAILVQYWIIDEYNRSGACRQRSHFSILTGKCYYFTILTPVSCSLVDIGYCTLLMNVLDSTKEHLHCWHLYRDLVYFFLAEDHSVCAVIFIATGLFLSF